MDFNALKNTIKDSQNEQEVRDAINTYNGDVNQQDMQGKTLLMWACQKGNKEAVEGLLNKGAAANISSEKLFTALMYACIQGDLEIVKLLVNAGADINARSDVGMTPLAYAKTHKNQDVIEFLEKKDAKGGYRKRRHTRHKRTRRNRSRKN